MAVLPSGWPRDLPPPHTEEFLERLVPWLVDRGSSELHTSALRRYPIALALVVEQELEGATAGLRAAYASARRELGEQLDSHEISEVLQSLEVLGSAHQATLREVRAVRAQLLLIA